ncbi:ALBINO3-like protein 3, mitochondrial, partial [Ananas comosus]
MGSTTQLRHLRRCRRLSSFSPPSSPLRNPNPPLSPFLPRFASNPFPQPFHGGIPSRSFSRPSWPGPSDDSRGGDAYISSDPEVELGAILGSEDGREVSSVGGTIVEGVAGDGESLWDYPVGAVVALLDGYHDLTGLPWWVIISTSTLALRFSLLPVLILQLKKAGKIAELLPK